MGITVTLCNFKRLYSIEANLQTYINEGGNTDYFIASKMNHVVLFHCFLRYRSCQNSAVRARAIEIRKLIDYDLYKRKTQLPEWEKMILIRYLSENKKPLMNLLIIGVAETNLKLSYIV